MRNVRKDHGPTSSAHDGGAWLTLGQAAKSIGVSERTLRRWADAGRLPAFSTPGGHRRFRATDVDAFLADARVETPTEQQQPLVLVIDDDERRRAACAFALEAEGCVVREAWTPEAVFDAVDDQPPDLIVLNALVGGIDGIELLCRLRDLHELEAVSVIMFTAGERLRADGRRALITAPDSGALVDAARRMVAATTVVG